jgi:luciferase family oxidoreductase group 1
MSGCVQLSVLDVAPVGSGTTSSAALANIPKLARLAEESGYTRFWLAEHHGMPSIASSSPEILIHHAASSTQRIRVGSGGIMLPNHAPLRVAEGFHTLEAFHPGRIDLGLGRAPGTDPATSRALRPFDPDRFADQVAELQALSRGDYPQGHPFHGVTVVPDDVELPPIWILGSSGASAQLAGSMGLGYGFAGHFSTTSPTPALKAYRDAFRPSERFPEPHAILALSVICAPTEDEADYLSRSMDLAWVQLRRGRFGPLPTPEEAMAHDYSPQEEAIVSQYRKLQVQGTPKDVAERLRERAQSAGAQEIMVSTMVHDPEARLRSHALLAEAMLGEAGEGSAVSEPVGPTAGQGAP